MQGEAWMSRPERSEPGGRRLAPIRRRGGGPLRIRRRFLVRQPRPPVPPGLDLAGLERDQPQRFGRIATPLREAARAHLPHDQARRSRSRGADRRAPRSHRQEGDGARRLPEEPLEDGSQVQLLRPRRQAGGGDGRPHEGAAGTDPPDPGRCRKGPARHLGDAHRLGIGPAQLEDDGGRSHRAEEEAGEGIRGPQRGVGSRRRLLDALARRVGRRASGAAAPASPTGRGDRSLPGRRSGASSTNTFRRRRHLRLRRTTARRPSSEWSRRPGS